MFSNLINTVDSAAKAIVNQAGLPSEAQDLKSHAAAFSTSLAPTLTQLGVRMASFAGDCSARAVALQGDASAWQKGDGAAPNRILQGLSGLLDIVNGLLNADGSAYASLSRYRDQILGDQRTIATLQARLDAQLAGLNSKLRDDQRDLEAARSRLRFLYAIPFPLAWIAAEIGSLITSQKTLEQSVVDVSNDLRGAAGAVAAAQQAVAAVGSFGTQLQVLEGALQNLVNSVTVTQGQMQQAVGSLQASQKSTSPVVVTAYLVTLKSQADTLAQYLKSL